MQTKLVFGPMPVMNVSHRAGLPLMKTFEDALALCEREQDDFYLNAYKIQSWLRHLLAQAAAQYADKTGPGRRPMQMGQAQHAFLEIFGQITEGEFLDLLQSLYRFTESKDRLGRLLHRALVPLSIEQECGGELIGPRAPDPSGRPVEAAGLMRQSVDRWCDWLEAVIHLETHAHWQAGRAGLAPTAPRDWLYPELDEALILCWPLVKRHNWTYPDLLNVLHDVLRQPDVYPCRSEQILATYCTKTLHLHKLGRGQTTRNGRPVGYDVALRLCLPEQPARPTAHAPRPQRRSGIAPRHAYRTPVGI